MLKLTTRKQIRGSGYHRWLDEREVVLSEAQSDLRCWHILNDVVQLSLGQNLRFPKPTRWHGNKHSMSGARGRAKIAIK